MRSPGHGYTLLNTAQPETAAAAAALSGSGDYGPQLLIDNRLYAVQAGAELLP